MYKDLESSNWHNLLKNIKVIHTTYIISRSESARISSLHFQCFVFSLHFVSVSRDERLIRVLASSDTGPNRQSGHLSSAETTGCSELGSMRFSKLHLF